MKKIQTFEVVSKGLIVGQGAIFDCGKTVVYYNDEFTESFISFTSFEEFKAIHIDSEYVKHLKREVKF